MLDVQENLAGPINENDGNTNAFLEEAILCWSDSNRGCHDNGAEPHAKLHDYAQEPTPFAFRDALLCLYIRSKCCRQDRSLLSELAIGLVIAAAGIAKVRVSRAEKPPGGKNEAERQLAQPSHKEKFRMTAKSGAQDNLDDKKRSTKQNQSIGRPRVTISANDSLTRIGQELFDDPLLGWLIANINMGRVREQFVDGKRIIICRREQELELPLWSEIAVFYQQQGDRFAPELITVVEEPDVDCIPASESLTGFPLPGSA